MSSTDQPSPDLAEFVSDYVRMLDECGERFMTDDELAQEIAEKLRLEHGVEVTNADVAFYLR